MSTLLWEQFGRINTRVVIQWESNATIASFWEFNATETMKATLWLFEIFECRPIDGGVINVDHRCCGNDPDGIHAIMENLNQMRRIA
jgi:hypothetical protein